MKNYKEVLLEGSDMVSSKDLLNNTKKVLKTINSPKYKITYTMETRGPRHVILTAKMGSSVLGALAFNDMGFAGDSLSFDGGGIFKITEFYELGTGLIKKELGY